MKVLRPNFEKRNGLITVIAQDARSKEVVMHGFANEEAYKKSLAIGNAVFWSTSRNELWEKGEKSGNRLILSGPPLIDCDGDALVYLVNAPRVVCHTGQAKCFYRNIFDPFPDQNLTKVDYEVLLKNICPHAQMVDHPMPMSFRARNHGPRKRCLDCGGIFLT